MGKFVLTKYTGVRYREDANKRHGLGPDKYFFLRYYRGGKQHQEGVGWASAGWSPAKAHKLRSEITANIKVGSGPQSLAEMREHKATEQKVLADAKEARKTFSSAGDIYITDYSFENKKTWKHDRARLNLHLKPVFGHVYLGDLDHNHVEELKRILKGKGLARATIVQCLALTRQICNYAIRQKWLSGVNPVKDVKFPKVNNQRLRYCLPDEEIKFFKMAIDRGYTDCHDICLISLYTGMRMGEIFALTRQDVDPVELVITIKGVAGADDGPKSGKSRVAYINKSLAAMFTARVGGLTEAEALLFPSPSGGLRKEIGENFATLMKHLEWNKGVTDRRLRFCAHCFRHTFASRLVAKGVALPVVQKLMGHATIQTTMRYTHTHDDQCRSAVDLL